MVLSSSGMSLTLRRGRPPMADITMCTGKGCNLREDCYRYRADPDPHGQSWFATVVYDDPDSCEQFWCMRHECKDRGKE